MPYREAADMPGLRWKDKYQDFYAGSGRAEDHAHFAEIVGTPDSFVPDAVNKFSDSDLAKLLKLSKKIHALSEVNSYNFFFLHLVNKSIVLLLDRSPELFDELSEEEMEFIFGAKLSLPTEIEVYTQVYAYIWGRSDMPFGSFHTGESLRDILIEIAEEEPELLGGGLMEALSEMDVQYQGYLASLDLEKMDI